MLLPQEDTWEGRCSPPGQAVAHLRSEQLRAITPPSGTLHKVDKATGALLEVRVGDKALAIRPRPEGGTWEERLPEATRHARASRLFLDLTTVLRHPVLRRVFTGILGHVYEKVGQGLETLTGRPAFQRGANEYPT